MKNNTPLVILATLSTLTSTNAIADWSVQKVRPNDQLNLRQAPDSQAQRIGQLAHNARCIKNLGCTAAKNKNAYLKHAQAQTTASGKPRWCLVQNGNDIGWAAAYYLREDPDCD